MPSEPNRDIQPETNPWGGWENARPDANPNYPAITQWMDKNIPAFLREWPIPVGDLCPATFELPDLPHHPDPSPPYYRTGADEIPRARPRPLRPEERNSIPFSTMARHRSTRTICIMEGNPLGLSPWPTEDTDNKPGPSQRRGGLSDTLAEPDPFADPHPYRPDDDPFKKYSAPTEPPPGNSDDRTSNNDWSGHTLETRESTWTSTSPLSAAIQSSENRPIPTWPRGYTPIEPGRYILQTRDKESHIHDHELILNRGSWRQTYEPSQSYTKSGWPSKDFEFNLDQETYGDVI
ncbi:hypothetical protein ARMGADRAFT_1083341 [Armillaria gallica]|uniref:Uncharacterized protein n=1 Tax=Armillaria gallica TaxID=47427 RepID=A0A2H3DLA7_ARMGA|nr:hypothetical protein ARMGADRAFT_1083341 [Armillaria gallica]